MRGRLVLLGALACLALGGAESELAANSSTTPVPNVKTLGLGIAVSRLEAAGLVAMVRHFPRSQPGATLETFGVARQFPPPGTPAANGSAVELTINSPPLGTNLTTPGPHPVTAVVPSVVGAKVDTALAALGESGARWLITSVPPLRSPSNACGLRAYIVEQQHPRAGTTVPWNKIVRLRLGAGSCPLAP